MPTSNTNTGFLPRNRIPREKWEASKCPEREDRTLHTVAKGTKLILCHYFVLHEPSGAKLHIPCTKFELYSEQEQIVFDFRTTIDRATTVYMTGICTLVIMRSNIVSEMKTEQMNARSMPHTPTEQERERKVLLDTAIPVHQF